MHLPGLRLGQTGVKRDSIRMFGISYGRTGWDRRMCLISHPWRLSPGSGVGLLLDVDGDRVKDVETWLKGKEERTLMFGQFATNVTDHVAMDAGTTAGAVPVGRAGLDAHDWAVRLLSVHPRCHTRAAARRRRDPERGPPAAGARGFVP